MAHALLPGLILVLALSGCSRPFTAAEPTYQSVAFASNDFTSGIEGPACDQAGNVYCVSYLEARNIGRITPDGRAELFVTLPPGSTGNGIRFDRAGLMYVADYTGHNILRINVATRAIAVFAHNPSMNQPNDLAIAPDGTLYASDPNWGNGTGQLWRITPDGVTHREAADMGTTNGIEVSPDARTLYVNESVQRNVWAFDRALDGSLSNKRLIHRFDDFSLDGMRCDVDGNLYVTRHGKGVVVVLDPQGAILREIPVLGARPSNLCFGGPDGRTVYVTDADQKRLIRFRSERPGLEWARWR